MIILDNIIFSLQRAGGISVFWQQLISYLLSTYDDVRYIEHPSASDNIFRKELALPSSRIITRPLYHKLISQFLHPKVSSKEKFIFHSSFFRTCRNPKAINVTTVHDFIYQQSSKMSLRQRIRTGLNTRAITESDAVVCVSENTKHDLLTYVPQVNPDIVHVIHNGVADSFRKLDHTPYPELADHILYVGGRQSYKNFSFLLECIRDTRFSLIICGSALTDDEISRLNREIPGRYRCVTYPTNDELNMIYNSVFALAYPSSYEGFGIPVIEAQRCGCPVIALNASSIPEIIGDKTLLMNNLSQQEFSDKIDILLNNSLKSDVVSKGLDNSKRFSWERMAREYVNLYDTLLVK
ncbi:MAG: glycosyltransferase family 4 protein [Bacteroides sp.]|nr:glycosyltransferase family 4 protein [Barnesiella sp.]MBD5369276.1 glycosyltransferase family 4 protein [Bacteroides sp.]